MVRIIGDIRDAGDISTGELKQKLKTLKLEQNRKVKRESPLIREVLNKQRREIKDELKRRDVPVRSHPRRGTSGVISHRRLKPSR